ncbi:hypothetical protein NPIL_541241 [Nephila pilipes]|uniref:Uncharacterized protein n=1 Tax=Nephila pilipes TaxID=299642 RepID=A0A8X6U8B6_NEPPI|nr:hypothetical protein NPIL_541241 [Nephila pilipes]
MKKFIFCLVVFCTLFYEYVDAHKHKCKDDFKKAKNAMNEMIQEGSAPACYEELNLSEFNCTGGEDEEFDRKVIKKFKDHMKSLPEDDQKAVMECMSQMGEMAMEKVGDEISDECKEKMKKMQEKMTAKEES